MPTVGAQKFILVRRTSGWIPIDVSGLEGATENAGVENAIRAKLQGWKMQDWKMREQTAGVEMQEWKKREQIVGVENAGVSRMERQPEIILRQP